MRMNSSYFFTFTALSILVLGSLSAKAQTITNTPAQFITVNTTYNFAYIVTGASSVNFTVTSITPPTTSPPTPTSALGLSLTAAGVLTAAPTAMGTYTVTVDAGTTPDVQQTFSVVVGLSTVPEGMLAISLLASGGGATSYFSLPLTADPVYSGAVATVTANTISVTVDANDPAPFVNGATGVQLASLTPSSGVPYFVKFLSGAETGRVIEVTANTSNNLTLDTTDNSSQTTPLTTSGFAVAVGDTFEVFPAATLGSLFGDNTTITGENGTSATNTLALKGSTSIAFADSVSIFNSTQARFQAYFFNTSAGYWELSGSTTNANSTVIYPYSALEISRRSGEAALSIAPMAYESSIASAGNAAANILVPMSRVAEVAIITKTPGSNKVVYGSTNYPIDMTLSQLMGSPEYSTNWTQSSSVAFASTISVYNATNAHFDTYFEFQNNWYKAEDTTMTNQNNFVIPAGSLVTILKRGTVSLQTSFLSSVLPYSLN